MVSKACVVGTYQRKLEELAALPGIELTLVVPPEWRERSRVLRYEPLFRRGYQTVVLPMALNGHYHMHFYRGLAAVVRAVRPDLIHVDEEPADLVALQCVALAGRARLVFFTWQNLLRPLPPPFSLIQRHTFARSSLALCGNAAAIHVLRSKGYRGLVRLVPQFGFDEELFRFRPKDYRSSRPLLIGAAGRLVPEKGFDLLLAAVAEQPDRWRVEIAGDGPEGQALRRLTARLGIADRVQLLGQCSSVDMPDLYARWDVVVAPSRTRPNWKEQFGRSVAEAMSCGTPAVVSRSGELPNVVGGGGLVFEEGNATDLRACLVRLAESIDLRRSLALAGRQRVLEQYTQRAIAQNTRAAYCDALQSSPCL